MAGQGLMGLLKEFRPVASTQGRRKICKSRGCFRERYTQSGGGPETGGWSWGTYPSAPPVPTAPAVDICLRVTHFFFLPSFFSLCLGDFAVASKSPLLNCKSSPMGYDVVQFNGGRKSTQKYVRKSFQFEETAFRTNSLHISHAMTYISIIATHNSTSLYFDTQKYISIKNLESFFTLISFYSTLCFACKNMKKHPQNQPTYLQLNDFVSKCEENNYNICSTALKYCTCKLGLTFSQMQQFIYFIRLLYYKLVRMNQ